MKYFAIFTSPWTKNPDESFASEGLDKSFSFIIDRVNGRGYNDAYIVKVNDDGSEKIILSMRTVK